MLIYRHVFVTGVTTEYYHIFLIMKEWPVRFNAESHTDFETYIFDNKFLYFFYL